ncbi:MAG: hypothetical protein QNK36_04550 [Colwellia sp.]|nr:hypothetical protein [Colwellia sp.]
MDTKLINSLKRDLFLVEKAHLVGGMKTFIESSNVRTSLQFKFTSNKVKVV